MKNYSLFVIALLAFLFTAASSMAQLDISQDEVTYSDIGVSEPDLLPTNPLYFFKEWGRGLRMIFIFNPVAKTEYELNIASEKIAEVKKVQELKGEDEKAIAKALENYQKSQERLADRFESLKDTSQNPNIDRLLEKLADRTVRHEQLFDHLLHETKHDSAMNSIRNTKARLAEILGEASKKDESQRFVAKLEKVFIESRGGDFKNIRSIEILDEILRHSSEDLREALLRLREQMLERAKEDIRNVLDEEEDQDFIEALESLPGDAARRALIIGELRLRLEDKFFEDVDEALETKIVEGKDIARMAEEIIENTEDLLDDLQAKIEKRASVSLSVKTLFANAKAHLDKAKEAFEQKKYGEAFGLARSAWVEATSALRSLQEDRPDPNYLESYLRELEFRIQKYEEFVFVRLEGEQKEYVQQQLSEAKKHLEFAKAAFIKGDLPGAKLHIGHVLGYLENIVRIIEGKETHAVIVPPSPVRSPVITEEKNEFLTECGPQPLSPGNWACKDGRWQLELTPPLIKDVPTGQIYCTQEYNPVCGSNGKTYSNECMAKAAGVAVSYRGECGGSSFKEEPTSIVPPPVQPISEFFLEADDYGFYPEATITAVKGSKVRLTFAVRDRNVYYGGLAFRSPYFDTGQIRPGEKVTVEFIAQDSFEFKSFWPLNPVLKATGQVVVK